MVGKGSKASGKKLMKEEVLPSPHGIRVAPKIPDELRKKAAQAVAAKDRKDGKVNDSKYFHIGKFYSWKINWGPNNPVVLKLGSPNLDIRSRMFL